MAYPRVPYGIRMVPSDGGDDETNVPHEMRRAHGGGDEVAEVVGLEVEAIGEGDDLLPVVRGAATGAPGVRAALPRVARA